MINKKTKKNTFGEVFTPITLVIEMLDFLPNDIWKDTTKKWLDNSCGHGAFLVIVKDKLMDHLSDIIPNDQDREKYILDNMIYGIELQEDNWKQCRINLGLTPTGNDGNIICTNAIDYDYSFEKNKTGYKTNSFINIEEL